MFVHVLNVSEGRERVFCIRKAASPETPLMHYTATQQAVSTVSERSAKEVLRQSLTCPDRCAVAGNKFHQPQNLLCQCGQLLRRAKVLYSVGAGLITQTITFKAMAWHGRVWS